MDYILDITVLRFVYKILAQSNKFRKVDAKRQFYEKIQINNLSQT